MAAGSPRESNPEHLENVRIMLPQILVQGVSSQEGMTISTDLILAKEES